MTKDKLDRINELLYAKADLVKSLKTNMVVSIETKEAWHNGSGIHSHRKEMKSRVAECKEVAELLMVNRATALCRAIDIELEELGYEG